MLISKSRIYEKNLFKNIYTFPIIFSGNKSKDFIKLCKKSTIISNRKLFDYLYEQTYENIDYVFDPTIEEWLVARNNEGKLNDFRFATRCEEDYIRCVKCHKYFSYMGHSGLDHGGICPRKGCDAVYTYDCDCDILKYKQEVIKRETPYDDPFTGSEDDPEEYDLFRNLQKNPSINNEWEIRCTKCGVQRSVESNW